MSSRPLHQPVAILHQGLAAPTIGGITKPMKPGGYRDSSADIAFALREAGIDVVTPVAAPDPRQDLDWSFPDTPGGIEAALSQGAQTLWANTVLSSAHPLTQLKNRIWLVGQLPATVQQGDDKWATNQRLRKTGLPLPRAAIIALEPEPDALGLSSLDEIELTQRGLSFPLVLKPIRGRGSEGVVKVETLPELIPHAQALFDLGRYGNALMLEEFLSGEEITLTVMPPGRYDFSGNEVEVPTHWSLPPVRRFNHHDGIAPYNGIVVVTQNSLVVPEAEQAQPEYRRVRTYCNRAADEVQALAPIRVDCRRASDGEFRLFDLNMKPNMTGAGRPGREEQDSLSCIAARAIGWSYTDLLLNMLGQAWSLEAGGVAS